MFIFFKVSVSVPSTKTAFSILSTFLRVFLFSPLLILLKQLITSLRGENYRKITENRQFLTDPSDRRWLRKKINFLRKTNFKRVLEKLLHVPHSLARQYVWVCLFILANRLSLPWVASDVIVVIVAGNLLGLYLHEVAHLHAHGHAFLNRRLKFLQPCR